MKHRTEAAPRQGLAKVLAGAAVVFAVLGVGSVSCAAQDDRATPPAVAGAEDAPPEPPAHPAAPMAPSEPLRINIPARGVTSELMDLGLRPDGSMEVPPGAYPAGWYTGAPAPGELGPAIIAAHVDWKGEPGVFYEIHELEPGDEIIVDRADGSTAVFHVDRVHQYPKNQFPTEAVYGNVDHAGLRLITCGGEFNEAERSYVDNIVVYASLVGSSPAA